MQTKKIHYTLILFITIFMSTIKGSAANRDNQNTSDNTDLVMVGSKTNSAFSAYKQKNDAEKINSTNNVITDAAANSNLSLGLQLNNGQAFSSYKKRKQDEVTKNINDNIPNTAANAHLSAGIQSITGSVFSVLNSKQSEEIDMTDKRVEENNKSTSNTNSNSNSSSKRQKISTNAHLKVEHMSAEDKINKPYECEFCTKRYQSENGLKLHKLIHNPKCFACEICPKRFARADVLTQHTLVHTKEKPFKCFYCKLRFSQSTNRRRHALRYHLEKMLKDMKRKQDEETKNINDNIPNTAANAHLSAGIQSISGSAFSVLNNMQSEEIDMTDERVEEKNNSTSNSNSNSNSSSKRQKISINAHLKVEHVSAEDKINKPYECEFCKKRYKSLKALKLHLKNHNPKQFACQICRKRFTHAGGLKKHTMVHTGVKPFECFYCKLRFPQRNNRNKHEQNYHPEMIRETFSDELSIITPSLTNIKEIIINYIGIKEI